MLILTVIFAFYFFLLIVLLFGWRRALHTSAEQASGKEPMISVIIPVRNEQSTIGSILTTLAAQEYNNFEIIVVDDHSEDETLQAISEHPLKNLRIVRNKGNGKKAAISAGVQAARGSIVVTTDADCRVYPQWLKHVSMPFNDHKAMMVFGAVRMENGSTFFDSLQALEFSSLIGVGAASAALGLPTTSSGANLAFRKMGFTEVKGYDDNLQIPSGDDEFLMRKFHHRYEGGVRFNPFAAAVVTTNTQPDVQSFVNQRIRWASKWRHNSSRATQILAVGVVLFQIAFIINWFCIFTPYIIQSLFFIAVKTILEAAFLLQVCRFLRTRWKWHAFFSLQVLYPFYVIGIGLASFFQSYEWKHRRFKPY